MKSSLLPRYFFASVFLLLVLVFLYGFFESRRLRQDLIRQTEAKGTALAEAMETGAKNAILGNSLLEELIGERLLDNARLIDQFLLSGPLDQELLKQISVMNRLQKVELLDARGEAWEPPSPPGGGMEMRPWMREGARDAISRHRRMMAYIWGRRWVLPREKESAPEELPSQFREEKFWEGTLFGVAVSARSFPGIIAVHANADYILNFKKEIGVQRQIEELGRQSDIDYVALLDGELRIVAHTDRLLVGGQETDPSILELDSERRGLNRIVRVGGKGELYEVVKPVRLNGSALGFLKIGLSLDSVEDAWNDSLRSVIVSGLAILAVGILGMAAIFYNQQTHVEEVRALEAEVARRERLSALGNLAATVAHEVRNPLNAISMGLQRLRTEFHPTRDEEQYSRFLEVIRGEVQRLNSIVEEFLSLARPLDLKTEDVRIDELLKEMVALAETHASSSKVRITLAAPVNLPAVKADRNYFKQLLLNLVLNGVQAMPDGGILSLEARMEKGNLLVSVTDTGVGIPRELLQRIFEPYFTTKADGSGLGLAIARRIAEAHGGALTVESEAGRGARFQVSVPLQERE